jgi:hypothetical protein
MTRQGERRMVEVADAERHLAAVEGAKLSGAYVSDANPVTVSKYARQWAGTRPHRPTTATRVASLISKHIDGTKIGSMRLAAVRPSQVQAWVSDRAQVLSPSTLRLLVALLRSIFAAAVQDQLAISSCTAPHDVLDRYVGIDAVLIEESIASTRRRCNEASATCLMVLWPTGQPHLLAALVKGESELGGDHHLAAEWSQRFTDQFFVHEGPIHLSGIEERDTRSTAVRTRVIISCLSPAERSRSSFHAARANRRSLKAVLSKGAFLHPQTSASLIWRQHFKVGAAP